MDIYLVNENQMLRVDAATQPSVATLPPRSFLWLDATHDDVNADVNTGSDIWRDEVERITGVRIVEPHLIDATNLGHPSYFDSTQDYEMIVFRKLSVGETVDESGVRVSVPRSVPLRKAERMPVITQIGTQPVTFFLCDRALVTVSSRTSRTIEQIRSRLLDYRCKSDNGLAETERESKNGNGNGNAAHQGRPPSRPEDLLLRLLNSMVDRYLELRQPLTDQLDRWQRELLDPRRTYFNWQALLDARIELRKLENLCEEQHDALQEFRDNLIDTIEDTEDASAQQAAQASQVTRRNDILMVRINDVMEHIARVLHHARRLQDSVESAVQLHFSATAHRTNEIVRLLTVITAIFAPLTLITGIFGMNFEDMPLLKDQYGFWLTIAVMVVVAGGLWLYFRLSRIIERR